MPSMDHENALRAQGHRRIAGIDEAGRGPLAGPVSAAAVVLPVKYSHPLLNDSKKLSEKQRETLYDEITNDGSIQWHCVFIDAEEIDRINILRATHLGMERAVLGLKKKPDAVLIDGRPVRGFPLPQLALVGGDGLSFSIAAASIIAKVTRDRWMLEMAAQYPEYGFERHKGYGTKLHLAALRRHGPCPIHRQTFSPVAQMELDL
ncbi:MAG: ribonuclease HII [Verrucomicrobiales bacterium]|nr:ribonuclease HII [Verrucomicrobiales bacterium]